MHLPSTLAYHWLNFLNAEGLSGHDITNAMLFNGQGISIKSSKQKQVFYSAVCKLNTFPDTYEITTENPLTFLMGNFHKQGIVRL